MIQTVNNINFKGFFQKANTTFTEKQDKIADDIKNKLGEHIKYGDYVVSPGAIKDTVELQHFIFGLKEHGNGLDKTYTYPKGSDRFIGTYDETHPFEIDDINVDRWGEKNNNYNTLKYFLGALIILAGILIGKGLLSKNTESNNKTIIEKITPKIKDSLSSTRKNSLNLFI